MTKFADAVLDARQVLARGQVANAVTGQGVEGYSVQIEVLLDAAGSPSSMPVTVNYLPHGWFAAWVIPARLPTGLAEATEVELTVYLNAPGYTPMRASQSVPGSHFALQQNPLESLPGSAVRTLSGATLDFRFQLAPDPVGLRGIVIYEHDPTRPVPHAQLSAAGIPALNANADGRFVIAALPALPVVEITVSDGTTSQTHHVAIDHELPVNVATLSLSQTNVENDHG